MSEGDFDALIEAFRKEHAAKAPTLGKPPKAFVCGTCFGSGLTRFGTCERCEGRGELDPPPRLPIERSVFESPAQRILDARPPPPPLHVPGPGRKRLG